ncbi:MAG TPA: alkaline phosphatase family protein, partial [Candidatus Baltobacteraceae bacterium]|nr:alkaline phosphatase family protein [Candidatus Baltobacteraceae bacterium]
EPRVVGGTELRLYERGPYGTQPIALALDKGEKRLYVALAGINAIAVLDASDPRKLHRVGLIPTGWFPAALALSRDGHMLYVVNTKGLNHDPGFIGDNPTARDAKGNVLQVAADSSAVWSTLERIDLRSVDLRTTTAHALSYQRALRPPRHDTIVPASFAGTRSKVIKHVVFILEENKTYDAMLGDLTNTAGDAYGPGDPALIAFDQSVTPNLHALARTFALAGNYFADADASGPAHQFVTAGVASAYTVKFSLSREERRPSTGDHQDPEDYPRAGYIFNALALRDRSYRDYGDLVRVWGYDQGEARDARSDDPNSADPNDRSAPTQGLGGLYAYDVPAPAVLAGHLDLNYPGWNPRIRDARRAEEFIRDFDAQLKTGGMPEFTHIWLPGDRGVTGKGLPSISEQVADGDRALGAIVEYLSHLPQWSSTAIFITPDDSQSSRDHINVHRSYAVVVSPYAKRRFVGMRHVSTVSILKTEEEILGLPPLSLDDALATDFSDFFTSHADRTPFERSDAARLP